MSEIIAITARQILDSRGIPTVEAEVHLSSGVHGTASVPSGSSIGTYEAIELRDGDVSKFNGMSVHKAVTHIHEDICPELIGMDVVDQVGIDQELLRLDGTENKSRYGSNTLLAVSLASARAASNFFELPLYRYLGGTFAHVLPVPMVNMLNGGNNSDNTIDFEEFMIVPAGASSFTQAVSMAADTFYSLKSLLKKKDLNTNVNEDGGFSPKLRNDEEAIELLLLAIEKAGYKAGQEIFLACDVAASTFYSNNKYIFRKSNNCAHTSEEMVDIYEKWIEKYPIISIEDGLSDDDWDGWVYMTKKLGEKVQLVGDDIFVTNYKRLSRGIHSKIANSLLIKLNQIGTITETMKSIEMAKNAGYQSIVSHRSGETEDSFIADLAVATNCGQIKIGSMSRTDRICKYNRLLRIEEELGISAEFFGKKAFRNSYLDSNSKTSQEQSK